MVDPLRKALAQGRRSNGASQEMAGFRQAEAVMDICNTVLDLDW